MMPDRYDEMRRRLMVDSAGAPIQDLQQADYVNQYLGTTEQAAIPVLSGSDARHAENKINLQNQMVSDIGAAALPTIMGLFGGGTAAHQANKMAEGSQYLQKRGAQEEDTKKNLLSVNNEENTPEYVRADQAAGMEPLSLTKSGTLADPSNVQSVQKMFNPKTGERSTILLTKDRQALRLDGSKVPDILDWQNDAGIGTAAGTNAYGTRTIQTYNKNAPNIGKQGVASYSGEGELAGIPTTEYKLRMKIAGEGAKKVAESQATLGQLDAQESTIRNSKNPMTVSIAIGQMLRTIEKRLSEPEQIRFMGGDYKSIFTKAKEWEQGNIEGEVPDTIRAGALEAMKYLKSREQGTIKSNKESYSSKAGLTKYGQKVIKRSSGQSGEPDQPISNGWKNKVKDL